MNAENWYEVYSGLEQLLMFSPKTHSNAGLSGFDFNFSMYCIHSLLCLVSSGSSFASTWRPAASEILNARRHQRRVAFWTLQSGNRFLKVGRPLDDSPASIWYEIHNRLSTAALLAPQFMYARRRKWSISYCNECQFLARWKTRKFNYLTFSTTRIFDPYS